MSSKRSSVRSQSSGKEVTKEPASLQKEIDTRIVDSDANRSHRCTEFSSVDEQKWVELDQSRESSDERSRGGLPVVKQRQTSSPVEFPQVPIIEMEFEDPDRDGSQVPTKKGVPQLSSSDRHHSSGKKEDCNMKDPS